ncbi:MAG: ABC transporter substrate-binding protein [Propioniciclava sp.]
MSHPTRPTIGRRQLLTTTVFGSAAAFALAGCGMTDDTPTNGGAGSGAADAGTLTAAYAREIISLDPHGSSDVDEGTLMACRHIYDSLVVRDGEDIVGSLATEWTQPDDLTWVFTLREGVAFSDGTPLTAEDVKASLERIAASETPQAALWAALTGVEASGSTVTIRTSEPLGTTLSNLTLLFIVPAAKLDDPAFFNAPIGSGPFLVESFTPSDHLHLVPNADYWGPAAVPTRIEIPYIPEVSTRLTELKSGNVDLTWTVPPDQIEALSDADGVRVEITDSWVYYFNWFNCSREPFTDARVRRAMWHALDVPTVVSSLFGQTATVATAPIPPTVFGSAPQQPYAYDPDRATALLAEAGLSDGFSVSLMWSLGSAPQIKSVAQAFAGYWSTIGVTVEMEELEQATWLNRLLALDWDMDLQSNSVTTGDADYSLGRLYTSTANRNGYANPDLDATLAAARAETDQEARKGLYAEACRIIWDEAVGVFPMDLTANYGLRESVQNFVPAANNQPMLTEVRA